MYIYSTKHETEDDKDGSEQQDVKEEYGKIMVNFSTDALSATLRVDDMKNIKTTTSFAL